MPNETLPKRAVLIVNTKSRRGKEWFGDARVRLAQRGIELEGVHGFRTVPELVQETQAAIRRRVPLVVLGGGDGTFSLVARHFVGSSSILGVLPLGTGNAFARDLGIPAQLDVACDVIAKGKVSTVDLGIAGDDYFLNVATVGLTTRIAQSLTVPMKRKYGRFVYAIAIVRALQRVKPFRVTLETENGMDEYETLQVVIGNGRFHAGPFPLSPDASITEGRLSVYGLNTTSRGTFLKLAIALPLGKHVDLPEVHAQETVGGVLRTFPPMSVTVDGEVCQSTPLIFRIAPDVLRVVTPTTFRG